VLDAFSRRCLGWALQRSSESALVLEALRMALMRRRPRPGLVHHSNRGVQYAQYASRDYTAQLEQHGIRISMSPLATPYDNATMPRGKFREDSQIRGSLPHRIPRPRGSQGFDQAVFGKSLQPAALALGAGLSSTAGVRTQLTTHGEKTSISFLRLRGGHGRFLGLHSFRSDL
jgi:transposase InsO family protein